MVLIPEFDGEGTGYVKLGIGGIRDIHCTGRSHPDPVPIFARRHNPIGGLHVVECAIQAIATYVSRGTVQRTCRFPKRPVPHQPVTEDRQVAGAGCARVAIIEGDTLAFAQFYPDRYRRRLPGKGLNPVGKFNFANLIVEADIRIIRFHAGLTIYHHPDQFVRRKIGNGQRDSPRPAAAAIQGQPLIDRLYPVTVGISGTE